MEIRGVVSTEGIGLALAACPLHLFSRDAVSPLSSWKSWKPLNSCGMICSGCSDCHFVTVEIAPGGSHFDGVEIAPGIGCRHRGSVSVTVTVEEAEQSTSRPPLA
jgi:hypothetical protein